MSLQYTRGYRAGYRRVARVGGEEATEATSRVFFFELGMGLGLGVRSTTDTNSS